MLILKLSSLFFQSGGFLKTMQDTKKLAQEWMKMSSEFEEFLLLNRTQKSLRLLLKSVDQYPFMYDPRIYDLTYKQSVKNLPPELQRFIRNGSEIFEEITHGNGVLSNKTLNEVAAYMKRYNQTGWLNTDQVRKHLKRGIRSMLTRSNKSRDIELLEQIDKINYMAQGWQAVLKPMKLDLFYGFPNETMLNRFIENRTHNDQSQKPLLSAILFDNIRKDGKLPRHVHYRIRMDSRILFSTASVRSRYWVPGPLNGNSKYYYFGFAWMQDSLERAIIELLTGRNVTNPGLYIQEIPYPCFLKDK